MKSARFACLLAVAFVATPTLGCWVLVGESFDGYSSTSADSDAGGTSDTGAQGEGGGPGRDGSPEKEAGSTPDGGDAGTVDAAPHPIDDCTPTFQVANGIAYPTHANDTVELISPDGGNFDTTDDVRCYGGTSLPYCLVIAKNLTIPTGKKLGAYGRRPLVLMAVQDVTIEADGILDIAGSDGPSIPGPGKHDDGRGDGFGSGGGNGEPGAGACGANGGAAIPLGLVGGGNGGKSIAGTFCQQGGSGGGAVQIVSLCGKISIAGYINGNGGGASTGDSNDCAQGFGGGAGGTVWLQAGTPIALDQGSSKIQLAGGGGSGGSCRAVPTDAWTTGSNGYVNMAGGPGTCGGPTGGLAGDGGIGGDAPGAGQAGSPGSGEATCGGGGGGRGKLVLQAPLTTCKDARTDGVCVVP